VEDGWHPDDFVEVGTLCRPHGVYGEMVVRIDTSFPKERFGTTGLRYALLKRVVSAFGVAPQTFTGSICPRNGFSQQEDTHEICLQ
jgi:hypothetical protein